MVNIDTLLENAKIEGTTDKKRKAFINSIDWDTFIELLEEVKRLRECNSDLEKIQLDVMHRLAYPSPSDMEYARLFLEECGEGL